MTRNVEFEQEQASHKPFKDDAGMLGALLIKYGFAKDATSASLLMICIIGVCILTIIGIMYMGSVDIKTSPQPDPNTFVVSPQ